MRIQMINDHLMPYTAVLLFDVKHEESAVLNHTQMDQHKHKQSLAVDTPLRYSTSTTKHYLVSYALQIYVIYVFQNVYMAVWFRRFI